MSDRTERRPVEPAREPHPFDTEFVSPGVTRLVRHPEPDDILTVAIKRYANGKFFVCAAARRRFGPEVARALEQTAELRIAFDRSAFIERLEAAGLAVEDIRRALDSLQFVDETYSADQWRR